ncbi:MAG: FAD-dependent oxidoreductase [bacterium]
MIVKRNKKQRVVIVGAGLTGLSGAYQLLKLGYAVTLLEKNIEPGGLAESFTSNKWGWKLEKFYHHWFANDRSALNLAKEIGHRVIFEKPKTDIFYRDKNFSFDSPLSIITFPFFSLIDKIRLGGALGYLKFVNNYRKLESVLALPWMNKWMGKTVTAIVWDPLFRGKFSKFRSKISLVWFWARIKKRTATLAYPEGGFASFTGTLMRKIRESGGQIMLEEQVTNIKKKRGEFVITTKKRVILRADKILVTTPSSVMTKLFTDFPASYRCKLQNIKHLSAQVLILILDKQFMKQTYWLNLTDRNSPFVGVVEHTNFMNSSHYGGQHIVYVGNYLPDDHNYLKMSAKEMLGIFDNQLTKINPNYRKHLLDVKLFNMPDAQPIVNVGYRNRLPPMLTPIKNIYFANMDMVYPWDRGTNYAISMGEIAAKKIAESTK